MSIYTLELPRKTQELYSRVLSWQKSDVDLTICISVKEIQAWYVETRQGGSMQTAGGRSHQQSSCGLCVLPD